MELSDRKKKILRAIVDLYIPYPRPRVFMLGLNLNF